MTQFRLTQISDTHLGRRLPKLIQNFNRIAEHIDATRPDLVINSGDIGFDGRSMPEDLSLRDHCVIDFRSPAAIYPEITTSATIRPRSGRFRPSS